MRHVGYHDFFAFLAHPGEVLPAYLVSPGCSFRQTPHNIPGVGCQHQPVPLNCRDSSLHQVVSEVLGVKSEKQGPPAAQTWAWTPEKDKKPLKRKQAKYKAHTKLILHTPKPVP